MQEIENPPTQKAAKPVKRNFAWTEQKELTLANYVFKEKGYMRTDTNLTDKFTAVSIKISSDQAFSGAMLDGAALKKKWDRIAFNVDTKYAISVEGANLSGLDEEPSELDKLVLTMLKERFETAKAKEDQKVKDKERNDKMITHEKKMLARHDRHEEEEFSAASPEDVVSDCSDGSTVVPKTNKRRRSPSFQQQDKAGEDFEVEVLKAMKDDPRLLELEIAERKQRLEDSIADRAHARDIEKRRVDSEEKMSFERSKAEMERSKADLAASNLQMKMMEFFARNMKDTF